MAKGYAKRRNDFDLLSEIKHYNLAQIAKTQGESKEIPVDPALTLSSSLLREAFNQSNFDVRLKLIKRARREMEIDPFFKTMIDEMVNYQEYMKQQVVLTKGKKRVDITVSD